MRRMTSVTQKKGMQYDVLDPRRIKFTRSIEFPDGEVHSYLTPEIIKVGRYGNYRTLDEAIKSIRDASATKIYLIDLAYGEYEGSFILPEYVNLTSTKGATLTSTAGYTLSATRSEITNITINGNVNLATQVSIGSNCVLNGSLYLNSPCIINITSATLEDLYVYGTSAFIVIKTSTSFRNLTKEDAGFLSLNMSLSTCTGQILCKQSTFRIRIRTSALNAPSGKSNIRVEPHANSWIRLYHSLLSADLNQATIEREGAVGDVDVWTFLNGLSFGYGAGVVEHVVPDGNTISSELVDF